MIRLTAAILFFVSAMACGGATTTATASPSPILGSAFAMGSMNASGVTGNGEVFKGAGKFTVSIQIHGLKPSSSHISHVHIGTCAKQGNVAYALIQVVADASGNATATTVVPEYFSMPATGWYVNVHAGPDLSEAEYAPSVSCGDLPRN